MIACIGESSWHQHKSHAIKMSYVAWWPTPFFLKKSRSYSFLVLADLNNHKMEIDQAPRPRQPSKSLVQISPE
jgi:hypothetical protein